MQGSINKHPVNLQNCLGLLQILATEKIRWCFLTSIVYMSNLMLCQQQHVAHELQTEQAWPKMWRRNKNGYFLKKSQKIISVHGNIILNIWKLTLNLNWCEVSEPFKARHGFRHSVPKNCAKRAHMFKMIPTINIKYSSEQFQVICILNDYT